VLNLDTEQNDVIFCLRRFFPEVSLSFQSIKKSVEIGDVHGMLMPVLYIVLAYENMQSLKELPIAERIHKIIQIPAGLLKQMNMEFMREDEGARIVSEGQNMTVSVQFFSQENQSTMRV